MVKLQKTKQGGYVITIPIEKIKRKGFEKGQEFDIEFDSDGCLRLVPIGVIEKNNG